MEITTARLILREFRQDDWPAVLAYQSDPRYLRYYAWTGRTPAAVQEFVQIFLAQQREQPRTKFQLAVELKSSRQLIGNCGMRLKAAGAHEGDIGYELAPAHWGRGYATEAARSMLAFGFTQLGLHRISSWCIADNVGSTRVLQKLGMRQEGRLRENEYFKGRWWDTLMFGILDHEWRSQPDVAAEEQPVAVSDIYNYIAVSDSLITGGQPTAEQLRALAAAGFAHVINLATFDPVRSLADEAELVRSLGMAYVHIPVVWESPQGSDFAAFERTLQQLPAGKTLIHCAANFRVTAFYSLYAQKHLGWSEDEADAFRARIWQGSDHPVWREFIDRMKAQIATTG